MARHVFFGMVVWSVYDHTPNILPYACFKGTATALEGPLSYPSGWSHYLEPFLNPSGTVCHNRGIYYGFLFCLLFLQVMMVMWFALIVRVALRVIRGDGADDVRSDDEAEENEEDEFEYEEIQPLEEEVGVEAIDLKGWERRSGMERVPTGSTGVSLAGHSERKEILNRIGCEKQID